MASQWEDILERVRQHTKLVLLDALGVIPAGSERPAARQQTTPRHWRALQNEVSSQTSDSLGGIQPTEWSRN